MGPTAQSRLRLNIPILITPCSVPAFHRCRSIWSYLSHVQQARCAARHLDVIATSLDPTDPHRRAVVDVSIHRFDTRFREGLDESRNLTVDRDVTSNTCTTS